MALKVYNPVIYNLLGDLSANSKAVTPADIHGLGKIILKYDYADTVGVYIAHRHFDLDENEVMYEVDDSEQRIAEPRQLFDILKNKNVQPNFLSCGFDGSWYPVGYEESDIISQAWQDTHFLAETAKYLIENNLVDKLGLASRRSMDQKKDGKIFIEENRFESRQSITRPSTNEELQNTKAIPTMYAFNKDATTMEEWCVICSNCIYHHTN